MEVDPSLVNPLPTALPSPSTALTSVPTIQKRKKLLLSSVDPLFAEIRDKNFAVVGAVLNRVAKRINTDYEERHNAKTVTQIKDFVGRLGGLQAEHAALRLRALLSSPACSNIRSPIDYRYGLDRANHADYHDRRVQ